MNSPKLLIFSLLLLSATAQAGNNTNSSASASCPNSQFTRTALTLHAMHVALPFPPIYAKLELEPRPQSFAYQEKLNQRTMVPIAWARSGQQNKFKRNHR